MVNSLPTRDTPAAADSVLWRAPRRGSRAMCGGSAQPGRASGFTLLELLIVMVIIATLAAIAIPAYTRNVLAAREAVLREDLRVMRTAIDSYTVDKEKAPTTLDDLVQSGYLKAIPKDPITGRTDTWIPVQSDTYSTIDQTDSGINDVHSGAQQTGTDGVAYNTW